MTTSKLYNVLLLEGHRAQRTQMYQGFLGDRINGIKAEYSRGEAIKKARAFGGKIVESGNLKTEAHDATVTKIISFPHTDFTKARIRNSTAFSVHVDINGKVFTSTFHSHREIKNTLGITQKELNSFLKAK